MRRTTAAVAGIFLVLFVALSNVWGAPQHAVMENQLYASYQLGLSPSDICGDTPHRHEACPLCRFDGVATQPDQPAPLVGYITVTTLTLPHDHTSRFLRIRDTQALPRAPPAAA